MSKTKKSRTSVRTILASLVVSLIVIFIFISLTGFSWKASSYHQIEINPSDDDNAASIGWYFPDDTLKKVYDDIKKKYPDMTYEEYLNIVEQNSKFAIIKKPKTTWEKIKEFLFDSSIKPNDNDFIKIYKMIGNSIKESNKLLNGTPAESPIFIGK